MHLVRGTQFTIQHEVTFEEEEAEVLIGKGLLVPGCVTMLLTVTDMMEIAAVLGGPEHPLGYLLLFAAHSLHEESRQHNLSQSLAIGAALCRAFSDGARAEMWCPGCGRPAPEKAREAAYEISMEELQDVE